MRVGDKIAPLHHPILKPANLPDFLAVARRELAITNVAYSRRWLSTPISALYKKRYVPSPALPHHLQARRIGVNKRSKRVMQD